MASSLQKIILIALVLSIAIPISIGHDEDSDDQSDLEYSDPETDNREDSDDDSEIGHYLRGLCSDTQKSKLCWRIIKPEKGRFTNADSKNAARIIIDLATEKSDEIQKKLYQLYREFGDDKYISCASNYQKAKVDLELVKNNLDSVANRRIRVLVDDAAKELKSCKHQFGKTSPDPDNIRDKNKEFGSYVDIIEAATKRYVKDKGNDSD